MNLADARAELAGRGFDYLSAGRMNIMLNRALGDFNDFWPWPWLWRRTTGAAPLTIPDLKFILDVSNADSGAELQGVDLRDLDVTTTPGAPTQWWLDGPASDSSTTVRVYPEGDANLAVSYVADSSDLSADADTPDIPRRHHALWIDLAVIQAYKDSDNFPAAQALQGDVNAHLQALVERYETRNRQASQVMAIRAGSEDD